LNEVYGELNADLVSLGEQQGQIKEVANTIRGISEETRLLALNALIEAAGAGEYGERFGVVAGEVKSLADKAGRASQEINLILKGVEERIGRVLKVSERGQAQMQAVLELALGSGDVIRELVVNIFESSAEMEQVEQDIINMDSYTLEIQMATNQQYNASQQALETLQSIGTIAAQNASSSGEVTNSTQNLERLSHDLLSVLVA
jgi:methyl-accepting chemotaxis protein